MTYLKNIQPRPAHWPPWIYRCLWFLAFAAWSSQGSAANWVPLAVPQPNISLAYDRDRLIVNDGRITYWRLVEFGVPQASKAGWVKRSLYRERIHCQEHNLTVLAYYLQGEDGAWLEVNTTAESESPVVPDSLGDLLEEVLCYYVRDPETVKVGQSPGISKFLANSESSNQPYLNAEAADPGEKDLLATFMQSLVNPKALKMPGASRNGNKVDALANTLLPKPDLTNPLLPTQPSLLLFPTLTWPTVLPTMPTAVTPLTK